MRKLYLYPTEATARGIQLTAYHFGVEAAKVGSAVMMEEKDYKRIVKDTLAPDYHAVMVAIVEHKGDN